MLHALVDRDGELADGRRPAELLGQLVLGATEREVALLGGAGRPDRPGAVAEPALELTVDRAAGEGREGDAGFGVESVNGADHREQRGLAEVFHRYAPVAVSLRVVIRDVEVLLDQRVPDAPVARALVLTEAIEERGDRLCGLGHHSWPPSGCFEKRNIRPVLPTETS